MQFKTLMLVVYPSRDRERYIAKAWGGLLISTKAFGDASIKINSTKSLRFLYFLTLIRLLSYRGDTMAALFTHENVLQYTQ